MMSEKKESSPWYVYVLECQDKTYYTGISNNVSQRLKQHNLGKGAKYTRSRLPVVLVYTEKCFDHSKALIREAEIKKLTRKQKETLIN